MVQKLNFLVATFLGTIGLSMASEIFMEDDPQDKVDDFLFLLLGLFAIYWYRKNADKKSIMPVVLMAAGMLIKVGAIMIEISDKEAVGDDFGILSVLILAFIVVVYQFKKLKKAK